MNVGQKIHFLLMYLDNDTWAWLIRYEKAACE